MAVPVILDTDAGTDIDDLWALALAVRHPEVELLGVTTVSGDVQARARLVAKVLRIAGRGDVPVRAGLSVPISEVRRLATAAANRAPADGAAAASTTHGGRLTHTDLVRDDDPEAGATYADAIGFILETLDRTELPVALVGIGPWTNVAAVIERADSRQRSRIAQIALMGGELHLNMAESNLKHDPEAARVIFGSGLPVFDATWSVSRRLAFPIDEVRRLCERPASPLVRVLNEATERWWGDGMKLKPGPVCYDVVPVFWAAGEREAISCIGLEEIPVELDGSLTRGMLVSHPWRLEQAPRVGTTSPGSIAVTCDLDERALSRRYMELIFG